jgi:hypothetical protein
MTQYKRARVAYMYGRKDQAQLRKQLTIDDLPFYAQWRGVNAGHFFFNLHSGGWNQGPLDTAAT